MTKLNFNQLAALQGGENEEYCNTLRMILSNNCIEVGSGSYYGAMYGWSQGACLGNFESYRLQGCAI